MVVGFRQQLRSVRIPHPREMREKIQNSPASGFLLFGWMLSSFLALLVPLSKWATERNRYYKYYGKYNEYERQQEQYEQQQNGDYNNGNYGGYGSLCSWYDLRCKYRMRRYQQQYGNGEGGGGQEQAQMRAMLPGWYFFFGGGVEEDERQREEMGLGQNDGSMKFVYACTVIMFVAMAVFGFRSMYTGKDCKGVIFALLLFGQFSLMNLLTTVQGTVETDNRFFEDSVWGWWGQWSVLVAYTDFWICLHCYLFAAFLGIMRCLDKRAHKDVEEEKEVMEMGYVQEQDDRVTSERREWATGV